MNDFTKPGQVIVGLFVLIVGSLALIDNLGFFDTRFLLSFWPLVFVALGVLNLRRTRGSSSRIVGVLLIVFGLLFTLSTTGAVRLHFRDWWPVLLIAGGALTVWKGWRERQGDARPLCAPFSRAEGSTTPEGGLNAVAFMSGNRLRADAQQLTRGEVTAMMGAVVLDLRQTAIDGEARLEIFALWGGIEIRVPGDWMVVSNCVPILGGIEDRTVPPMDARKKLVLEGYVIMGGVEIKN